MAFFKEFPLQGSLTQSAREFLQNIVCFVQLVVRLV